MPVYTHNIRDNYDPCTFVKMIVTDAPLSELDLSDDWFEVDAEEVSDIEELSGMSYPASEGHAQINASTTASGHTVRKYGRL